MESAIDEKKLNNHRKAMQVFADFEEIISKYESKFFCQLDRGDAIRMDNDYWQIPYSLKIAYKDGPLIEFHESEAHFEEMLCNLEDMLKRAFMVDPNKWSKAWLSKFIFQGL